MRHAFTTSIALLALLAAAPARAEEPPPAQVGRLLATPTGGIDVQLGAELRTGVIANDLMLSLEIGAVFLADDWQLAPRLPLRFRVRDAAPHDDAVIRKQDWDEPSDFARLLAYFEYGRPGDPLFVHVGELNLLTVGHGSLVNLYTNSVDIDHYQGGVWGVGDAGIAGAELLVDDFLEPNLALVRPFVRPLSWLPDLPLALQDLKIGITAGADFAAPLEMARDAGGLAVDERGRPTTRSTDVVPMLGIDVELPVLTTEVFELTPYVDVASTDLRGVGVHAGAALNVRFDPLTELRTRVEYRYAGPDYLPGHVGPFYEIARLDHRDGRPLTSWLRDGGARSERHGGYVELDFRWAGMVRALFAFADAEGPGNTDVLLSVSAPRLGPIAVSLFFARMGLDAADEFLDARRTVLAASVRYNVLENLYVRVDVENQWWLQREAKTGAEFATSLEWDVGVGAFFHF